MSRILMNEKLRSKHIPAKTFPWIVLYQNISDEPNLKPSNLKFGSKTVTLMKEHNCTVNKIEDRGIRTSEFPTV